MGVTKTQAIQYFLETNTRIDLASLYSHDMECQVNVAQDNGERIEGDYKGKQWHGWTDGIQIWKSFRIPWKANTEPEYDDRIMSFDLKDHAEGIGMTGWDWKYKLSRWVAFDFDALVNHSGKGLTYEQLQEVKDAAFLIPWVTIRYSTSGKGLHLYVMLDPVNTDNHTEHAALARSILGLMSANTGFDFNSNIDVCGGNMWIWHRKMVGTNGLEIIKQGCKLFDVPINWKDHLKVISGKRKKILPSDISEEHDPIFEEITGQQTKIKLDDEHQKLIKFLDESSASFWWDQDHHMLVAHTFDLAQAHEHLHMRGVFKTVASGKDHGHDHNSFCLPQRKGAWVVRRFTPGVKEADSWDQDSSGWTRCYFNRDPDLKTAARFSNGIEDEGGIFVFRYGSEAQEAAIALGADINLPAKYNARRTILKAHKDGKRLVVEFDRQPEDTQDDLQGWLVGKGNKWRKIFDVKSLKTSDNDIDNYDDTIRHLVTTSNTDCGWTVKADESWHDEPLTHIKHALDSLGLKVNDIKLILGNNIFKPWKLVNLPFQPEYPGDRQWNRNSCQFRFIPNLTKEKLIYPNWSLILDHIGSGLDEAVINNLWCKNNGLFKGADYLKCWIASLFQFPSEPLPYLFLYGPQNSGKSILHEALSLLISGQGICRADHALTSTSGFNGELENAILCIVEETDLKHNKQAYNKIKDWVTSTQLAIRKLFTNLYNVNNTSHWLQLSNERSACPIFPGDTRITMCYVDTLKQIIPKNELLFNLEKEASDFLAEVLRLEIPRTQDRLRIPVIESEEKSAASKANQTLLETFIEEQCFLVPGEMILYSDFYDAFIKWLEPNDRFEWSKIKVGRALPQGVVKGRNTQTAQWTIGNISFEDVESTKPRLIVRGEKLV